MKKISISEVIERATGMINDAHGLVTFAVRQALIKNGIPAEIAFKYSANYCHGGEWVLDDECAELADHDIIIMDESQIVDVVKELENL